MGKGLGTAGQRIAGVDNADLRPLLAELADAARDTNSSAEVTRAARATTDEASDLVAQGVRLTPTRIRRLFNSNLPSEI